MHAPSLRFAGEGYMAADAGETARPRPALLFVSPSFLLHAVRPCNGKDLRISVAMNFGLAQAPAG